jgi:hypothetical protein
MSKVRQVGVGHYRRRQFAYKRQTVASKNGQASASTRLSRKLLQMNILGGGIPLNAAANVLL